METLKYRLKKTALEGIQNNPTKKSYIRSVEKFAAWAKSEHHIRLAEDVSDARGLCAEYSRHLQQQGYSAATIHTYLAPVCRGFGICMSEIKKPKRISTNITKTRDPFANLRGKEEAASDDNARLVTAAYAIGIRRSEYARLTGDSLTCDYNGNLCLRVKGKGGKIQMQRILPQDVPLVEALFCNISSNQKVFSKRELTNHIDLHGIRAAHARDAYEYYIKRISEGGREALIEDLQQYFRTYHARQPGELGAKKLESQYKRFCEDMKKCGGIYKLKGSNFERAKREGRPTEYDRVALMAVSVFHLAHWRLDVTVNNYML